MADTVRTQAELLALYPDNNLNEISAQDLRDFVVSVGVYGELKRTTIGGLTVDAAPEKIVWDLDGQFAGTTLDLANDEVEILSDGVYDIRIEGSAELQTGRSFDLYIGVNGVAGMPIGHFDGKGDIVAIVAGCLGAAVAGDKISIMVEASGATSNFFLQVGSRMKVERKL